jgi:hypothetical protein
MVATRKPTAPCTGLPSTLHARCWMLLLLAVAVASSTPIECNIQTREAGNSYG